MNDLYLTILILALVLAEIVLFLTLSRWYFPLGLPLYRKRLSVEGTAPPPSDDEWIGTRLTGSWFVPFVFRRIGATEYGFRESLGMRALFRISYPPLMRGVLAFDAAGREVVVTGYANLWICALFVYLGRQFFGTRDPGLMLFFAVFVTLCLVMQASRFRRVADAAAAEWLESRDDARGH